MDVGDEKDKHIKVNPRTQALMCTLCEVDFTSVALQMDHMKGKRHAKNLNKLLKAPDTIVKKTLKKPDIKEGHFGKCEICNVFYQRQDEAETHLFSETHKAKQDALNDEREAKKLREKKIEETAKLHKKIMDMTKKLKAKREPDLYDNGIKKSNGEGETATATSTSTSSSLCPSPTGSNSLNPPPPIPKKHRSARWAKFYASTPAVKTQTRFTPFLPAFAIVKNDETLEEGKPDIETTRTENLSETNTNAHPASPARKVDSDKKAIASPVKKVASSVKVTTSPVQKITFPEISSASTAGIKEVQKPHSKPKKPPEEKDDDQWLNFYTPHPLPSLEETTPPPEQKPAPVTDKPSCSSKPEPSTSPLSGDSKMETSKLRPNGKLPKLTEQKLKRPKFCIHCGTKVPNKKSKFCVACGKPIVARVVTDTDPET